MEFPEVLNNETFLKLFTKIGAEPIWASASGKPILKLLGRCHQSTSGSYSVIFDVTDERKCHCFSSCGESFLWWNYVARTMQISSHEAKQWILDWLQDNNIEYTLDDKLDSSFRERPFELKEIEPIEPVDPYILEEVYKDFDTSIDTLRRTVWVTQDHVQPEILQLYGVAYDRINGDLIIPHRNIRGETIGLYSRSFKPLRREIKRKNPDAPYSFLLQYPRAKYIPTILPQQFQTDKKNSLSFQNSRNLFGLDLAQDEIKRRKIAIVVEGSKGVMLARQFGFENTVASHTFGMGDIHCSILINLGINEIICAWDKQYLQEEGRDWELYLKKTQNLAERLKDFVKISWMIDREGLVEYRQSPTDYGEEIFKYLFERRESLNRRSQRRLKLSDKAAQERKFLQEESKKFERHFII